MATVNRDEIVALRDAVADLRVAVGKLEVVAKELKDGNLALVRTIEHIQVVGCDFCRTRLEIAEREITEIQEWRKDHIVTTRPHDPATLRSAAETPAQQPGTPALTDAAAAGRTAGGRTLTAAGEWALLHWRTIAAVVVAIGGFFGCERVTARIDNLGRALTVIERAATAGTNTVAGARQ